ncbi:A-kinase anchor protein 12 [Cynocephalus volans]|uniref:A-kinase anchor protein 12 n=1 Tax=Cynocephalus volans TaxID=110931 RepID=UPI002FCC8B00
MLGTITITVGQKESEDVSERDSDKEMAANSAVVQDIADDGQEEMPEIIEQIPSSESTSDELAQPAESQANDVGFKKVFKFVGFKFTVKKEKTEKSDTVQLLTVKKEEGEGAAGAGDHQEPSSEPGEAASKETELKQSAEKPEEALTREQSNPDISSLQAESGQAAEEGRDESEGKQEKELSKSPESPTSPVTSDTASPFKKFFTQGWAGWRKKTSFKKPKEEELEASEKKKEQEPGRGDTEENGKAEDASEQRRPQGPAESGSQARLSAEFERVELPPEDRLSGLQGSSEEKSAPLATEIFDEKVEVQQEVVAEVHVSTSMLEKDTEEQTAEGGETEEPLPPEKLVETNAGPQEAEPAEELAKTTEVSVPGGDHTQPAELSPDDKVLSRHPEGIVGEVEMLSSQEKIKVQGSPLKKLFTSTGLKKLSGKKQKGKRGGGDEVSGEHNQVPTDSPDSADEQKGESSASSPEEPEDITCLEKGAVEGHQEGEVEEGATSDGEKKREGVTPWASFKKMVTPKKRVRRPSDSDKEDEPDKVKSATLSSAESAAFEMQEEIKGGGEEQKPEEPKRKVDTSVSWEALICVGSSKKRARKASSSDEEGGPKMMGGDSQKADEAGKDKDPGTDPVLASSQEHDQGQGSSSPEQAGSPTEGGEGVSTWESFKRLVTARKKSKSKLEEKNEDSVPGSGIEHSASDVEPGKEESWVSIKKFIPGRRKKRSDGKQEQATAEGTGPVEVTEDDLDVPAVVPLSEYDAVEREKMETQQAQKSAEKLEQKVSVYVSEELSKNLVHTVTVAVVDGTRAVTSIEERSPSWISASVTEPLEQAEDEATPLTAEVFEREIIVEETPVVTKTLPEGRDGCDDTIASELELTSEVVTAAETTESLCAEEATEASGAEETTEMVSAVSQLTDSPNTTEEATPVQEVEDDMPDTADRERRTQEILQAVAEKVKEESQLPDTSEPDDTIETMQKVESETPERAEEAETDSKALELEREVDVVLKGRVQETGAEHVPQEKVVEQTIPESFEKGPQVTESVEPSELITTCQAETLAGVKSPAVLMEQVTPPDSAETLTDGETRGNTPVADCEVLHTTQQDKIVEIQEDNNVASGTQSQATEAEAVPAQTEGPPAPSSFQSQEEHKELSKVEEILEPADKEVSVEAVPILTKMEAIQEAGQFADEETKDVPVAEGLELSTDTDMTISQEKVMEAALKDEVTNEGACHKNGSIELQSPPKSVPSPVGREMVVQVEREESEAKLAQVSEEKLEQTAAVTVSEELSKQLVHIVHVTVVDGETEVSSFEGSPPPCLAQEWAVCTEVQVQSSEASLTLTAAAVEEKVLGETVKILETGDMLESAGAHLVVEENCSEKGDEVTGRPEESQMESIPVTVSTTAGKGIRFDLEGEKTTSQRLKSDEGDGQVVCQEVGVSVARKDDLKAEKEILEFETESSKLVQNIIQTAVDQFVCTEETATEMFISDVQTQAHGIKAGQKTEKEECDHQASAKEETQVSAAKEESELTTAGQTCPAVSKDVSEAAEEIVTAEVASAGVNDKQPEEAILPPEAEGDGIKSVVEGDGCAVLEERIEKPPLESKEDVKGDVVDDPKDQNSAVADPDASGDLTKESPHTNRPNLREKEAAQEVEFQEGRVHSESDKEIKTQTQEEMQEQERESAKSELTES